MSTWRVMARLEARHDWTGDAPYGHVQLRPVGDAWQRHRLLLKNQATAALIARVEPARLPDALRLAAAVVATDPQFGAYTEGTAGATLFTGMPLAATPLRRTRGPVTRVLQGTDPVVRLRAPDGTLLETGQAEVVDGDLVAQFDLSARPEGLYRVEADGATTWWYLGLLPPGTVAVLDLALDPADSVDLSWRWTTRAEPWAYYVFSPRLGDPDDPVDAADFRLEDLGPDPGLTFSDPVIQPSPTGKDAVVFRTVTATGSPASVAYRERPRSRLTLFEEGTERVRDLPNPRPDQIPAEVYVHL